MATIRVRWCSVEAIHFSPRLDEEEVCCFCGGMFGQAGSGEGVCYAGSR
jgi:hypothetical protein